jgi:hypothetical protein
MWQPIETAPENKICYFLFKEEGGPEEETPFLGTLEEAPGWMTLTRWKPYSDMDD